MPSKDQFGELVRTYFRQQAELYGDEFYFERPPSQPSHDVPRETEKNDGGAGAADAPPEQLQQFDTLDTFQSAIEQCTRCRLAAGRTRFVFGVGNPHANLMCIGEGPGYDEDKQGEPFVGRAGGLLNKILAAIGFDRKEVYIANIVKCRPPGNREPQEDEIAACLPYLQRQIEMVAPKLILALGGVAARSLLNTTEPVSALRARQHSYGEIPVFVTYHPAALLRNTVLKRSTWEDVQKLRETYDQIVGDKPPMKPAKNG